MANSPPQNAPQQWDLLFTQPFTNKGEWNAAITYEIDNIVQYGGSRWIAIAQSLNQVPDVGEYWQLFVSRGDIGATGPAGETGATPSITIGTVTTTTAPYVESDNNGNEVILNFGLPKGDKGDTGFSPNRTTINFSSGSLNPGESTTVNCPIAVSAQILNLASSHAARVRIYQDSASAIADTNRQPGIMPTADVIIFSEVITIPTKLTCSLYKPTFVFSLLGTNTYPIAITNNTSTPQDINISLDTFILIP